MKNILVILITMVLGFSCISQNAESAKDLLDEVAEKVENYDNTFIDFDHNFDNNEADVHLETRGHVTLAGDLYHLNYMGTEQISDGEKIYLIIHEDEEVIIHSRG